MVDSTLNYPSNSRVLTAQNFIEIITLSNEKDYTDFYDKYDSFEKAIIIENFIIDGEIILDNEIIVDLPIIISDVHFEFYQIRGCTFNHSLKIESCTFQDGFHIKSGTFYGQIRIEDCTFKRYFSIADGVFHNSSRLINNKIEGYFNIENGNFQSDFWIEALYFQDLFTIEGGYFRKNMTIVDTTFNRLFTLLEGNFYDNFVLIHNTFHDNISIRRKVYFHKEFIFNGGSYGGVINFDGGQINHLIFDKLISKIEIEFTKIAIINSVIFRGNIQKDSFINLTGNLHKIMFDSFLNFGTIVISDVAPRYKQHEFFSNTKNSSHAGEPPQPQFIILNSDLGKTILINSKLSTFDLFFQSSKIIDISLIETTIPDKINTQSTNPTYISRQQQQFYSQLKKVFESRGDKVAANEYLAKELDAYKYAIAHSDNKGEYISLWLNGKSSYYGQNWLLALKWTLCFSLILYTIYCLFLGFLPCIQSWNNVEKFLDLAAYYPEFLNPIRKADYIIDALLPRRSSEFNIYLAIARVIESLSRIIIGFLIYQLVQAFRKHGRSSS